MLPPMAHRSPERCATGGPSASPRITHMRGACRRVRRERLANLAPLFLILFGTGIRFRSALSSVAAQIGGLDSEILFAGAQDNLAGLDQINVRLSRNLIGRGEVSVVLIADGKTANPVKINIAGQA